MFSFYHLYVLKNPYYLSYSIITYFIYLCMYFTVQVYQYILPRVYCYLYVEFYGTCMSSFDYMRFLLIQLQCYGASWKYFTFFKAILGK